MSYSIERLGHQGDGIAPGPVFAPRTLPGEAVTGDLSGDRLTNIRIETPSDHRVKPPCRHYKSCGGCQLLHASDDFVAGWKQDVVHAAMKAQGITAEIAGIETSPARSRRRATLSARRTKKVALVGFHAPASDVVTPIPDCQLLDPRIIAALPVVEALTMIGGSRKGELSVTVTASDKGPDMSVIGGKPLDDPLRMRLVQEVDRLGIARLTWDGEPIAQREPPTQGFGLAQVVPPAGAFLQATQAGESALLASAKSIIGDAKQVVDLFAGCGTFSLPLAVTAEVHAVEGERGMLQALDDGWRKAQGLKKVTTETRDLFRNPLQASELTPYFTAALIDPPRAGAQAQIAELAKSDIPVIAHISCNPVTFARDAAVLINAGFKMGPITVVDQFRWSTHVELCAGFTRK